MSRKIMKPNNQKISSKTKPCQLAVVAIGAIVGLALMFIRRFLYRFLHFFSTPVFMKEGEVTLIRRDRTNAVMINVEIAGHSGTPRNRTHGPFEDGRIAGNALHLRRGTAPFILDDEHITVTRRVLRRCGRNDQYYPPGHTTPYSLKTYRSHRPGQFVLETNAGFADKYDVTEGDRIVWKRTK